MVGKGRVGSVGQLSVFVLVVVRGEGGGPWPLRLAGCWVSSFSSSVYTLS